MVIETESEDSIDVKIFCTQHQDNYEMKYEIKQERTTLLIDAFCPVCMHAVLVKVKV